MRLTRFVCCFVLIVTLASCASRPINAPIIKFDPSAGYRPYLLIPKRQNNDPQTLFALSFSGGGTRAAAFSYGVLEELRRTNIVVNGKPRRLIDEVDLITGVSGGSFTALSYALYGDQLFSEYEERFLKRNVQGTLLARALNPFYWPKYIGGSAGRSELAADYYDEILFEGATFGDLLDKPGPVAIATGTDLSTGSRLAFFQNDFDLLCSDLNSFPLSRAAATSSAVPLVLSPVTLNNYGGTCEYEYPAWVSSIADPTHRSRPAGRAFQRYKEMQDFQNSEDRPYIHLVDGGVSDNIGVRGVLESLEELEASAAFRGQVGFGGIRKIVLMVVNAHSSPSTEWDRHQSPPGFTVQLLQSTGVPIDRYSFETVETMKDRAEIMKWRRELLVARARLGGMTEAQAEASVPNITLQVLDISFDAIADPEERSYFMNLPTSFVLPPEEVDRLRDVAGQLMQQSVEYNAIVNGFGKAAM
ncbi:MAG: patatin-like phospholipase family protein [Candidatus Competibacteraceae bacterium]|nr:patatin-like phospholipase family protein [Candidatus Competibacteraceae bacterium]MCB1805962.1 patatin-like phospholipase family protein [Candidatus Competibacteraceae bacterium]MCB1813591.1 patatin-like phospholipase family protein [Candidatus Competibacteraceae bacterium]